MRLLLDAGADPNAANDFAATPLMWCAGDAAKVRLLLSKGAKADARSKLGRTPLLISAAYDGATEAARLLIEKGADVTEPRDAGVRAALARVPTDDLHLLLGANEAQGLGKELSRKQVSAGEVLRDAMEAECLQAGLKSLAEFDRLCTATIAKTTFSGIGRAHWR